MLLLQALAAFDVRRQEIVGKELNRLKEGTNLLNELLNSMNLPAALGWYGTVPYLFFCQDNALRLRSVTDVGSV